MADLTLTRDTKDWRTLIESLTDAAVSLRAGEEQRLGKFGEDFEGFASGGKAAAYERYTSLRDDLQAEVAKAEHEDWVSQHPELEGVDCELCNRPIALTGCTRVSCPLRAESERSGAWLEEVKRRLDDPYPDDPNANFTFARNVLVGRRVRVRAGAEIIGSTRPRFQRGETLKRATVVTISSAFPAYPGQNRDDPIVPARIRWAGSGGYWRIVKLDDVVELIVD